MRRTMRSLFLFLLACGAPVSPQTPAPEPIALPDPPPPAKKKPALAVSTSTSSASPRGLQLVVTPDAIEVKGEVVSPEKKNGPKDLLIVQLQDVAKRSNEQEATLSIAPATSYRKVIEVLFTLGQSNIGTYHLSVAGPNGTASIDTEAPRSATMLDPSRFQRLNASVFVIKDGISVKMSGGNIVPGCDSVGAGLAIAGRDYEGLAACVAKVKAAKPEWAGEDTVTLTAGADIDFQTVVHTIDALRTSLPKVWFGIPR